MKVLVNAYAVAPHLGSEPGMGWNWCVHIARYHELDIIMEGEFRERIEAVLPSLSQGRNIHFHYLPVSDRIRKMCWNQGDWRFYWYYRQWQKRALSLAQDLCRQIRFDVIHQLNMVGFREPGFLWKIPDIRYVWGPVGGMSQVPVAFFGDSSLGERMKIRIKNGLNYLQMNYSRRVRKAVERASVVISATRDEQRVLRKRYGRETVVISETGLPETQAIVRSHNQDGRFHLLWVGRFLASKQLNLALRILAALDNNDIVLDVLGTGSAEEEQKYRSLAVRLGVAGRVNWFGFIPHERILDQMAVSDVFLFTSVHETTSTVIMEALSAGLPIVCFDACGFGPVVDETVGRKVPCVDPEQAVRVFSEAIRWMYVHPEARAAMSSNTRERICPYTWDEKMKQLNRLYGE